VGQNFIEITVTDTGVGMSKDQLSNLFSTALRKTRRGTDGEPSTGLGLMLCKDFIEKNGGKLSVISEEGVGSSFSFTIPTENKY
jgi:signal transduction histidine kinase